MVVIQSCSVTVSNVMYNISVYDLIVQEGYPDIAPIWSSDTENVSVTNILDKINEQPGQTVSQFIINSEFIHVPLKS